MTSATARPLRYPEVARPDRRRRRHARCANVGSRVLSLHAYTRSLSRSAMAECSARCCRSASADAKLADRRLRLKPAPDPDPLLRRETRSVPCPSSPILRCGPGGGSENGAFRQPAPLTPSLIVPIVFGGKMDGLLEQSFGIAHESRVASPDFVSKMSPKLRSKSEDSRERQETSEGQLTAALSNP
jgi:hypothetical protein